MHGFKRARVMKSLAAAMLLLPVSCRDVPTTMHHHPLVIGHRGASNKAPENTLDAFRLAFQQDADGVEGDFRLTRDGVPVCLHDATLLRTTGDRRAITDVDHDEVVRLDAGSWKEPADHGARIPTLRDVAESIPEGRLLLVEVKSGADTVPAMLEALSNASMSPEQCLIIAFDHAVVHAVSSVGAGYGCYLLDSLERGSDGASDPNVEDLVARALAVGATGVGVRGDLEVVDERFVQRCLDAGLAVNVWTVNDPDDARFFARMGVTSITTDRPGVVGSALRSADPRS